MDSSDGFEAHTCATEVKGIVVVTLPLEALITVIREVTYVTPPDVLTAALET